MPKKRKLKKAAKTLAKAAIAGGAAGMAGTRIGSMAKQTIGQTVGKGIDMYTDNVVKPVAQTIKKGIDMYTDKVVKPAMELPSKAIDAVFPQKFSKPKERKYTSVAKQMAPIDPMTGMPIQPQMTPQPSTVGMPGTMPMPDGMGHTLPEHGVQAGGRKMSPYMQKKTTVAGQNITESGHMDVSYQDGPKKGDLVRGKHLKYDNIGFPMDYDYEVKFEKDTVDQSGPYKIYKTTGIK